MTFDEWQRTPTSLPHVEVGGFLFNTLGSSLHEVGGQLLLAVLVDESDGASVVMRLDPNQAAGIRSLLPMCKETFVSIHAWLRELYLADSEIVGQTTNIVFAVFAGLVDEGDMDDA